jgi:surfactin synthase thioesterase subunit
MAAAEYERWWVRTSPAGRPRLRVYFFHFAGGSASLFHGWNKKLPSDVATAALQLPAREHRLREKPITSLVEAATQVATAMEPMLDVPACFFGYSMGCLIAFETARELARRGLPQPVMFFAAASPAPQCNHQRGIHLLSDEQMLAEIRRVGGTPEFVLQNPEIMAVYLPMIRADFTIIETYQYVDGPPTAIPIVAYGGLGDPDVKPDQLAEWCSQTTSSFRMQFFPGDHFFLKTAADPMLADASRELEALSTPNPAAR